MVNSDTIVETIESALEHNKIPYTTVLHRHNELYIRCPEDSDAPEISTIIARMIEPDAVNRVVIENKEGEPVKVAENWEKYQQ